MKGFVLFLGSHYLLCRKWIHQMVFCSRGRASECVCAHPSDSLPLGLSFPPPSGGAGGERGLTDDAHSFCTSWLFNRGRSHGQAVGARQPVLRLGPLGTHWSQAASGQSSYTSVLLPHRPNVGKAEKNPARSLLGPKGTYLLKIQLWICLLLHPWIDYSCLSVDLSRHMHWLGRTWPSLPHLQREVQISCFSSSSNLAGL